jgi:cell shape-determining protein MreD
VSLLWAVLALLAALALQAAAGQLWPAVHRFFDALLVPVTWYAIARSQRWALVVGCVAGLTQDAWFQVGAFGLNGFKKTLLGFGLGSFASRLDLNHAPGRIVAGAAMALGDGVLDVLLRRLVGLEPRLPSPAELLVKAGTTGLLLAVVGTIVEKTAGRVTARRPA